MRTFLLLFLFSCAPRPKPRVYAPTESATASTDSDAAAVGSGAEEPTQDKEVGPATDDPPASAKTAASAPAGSGGHCLFVGADKRAVRCYWKREDCDYQQRFNDGLGNSEVQECKVVAQLHCMKPSDGGELCYPTAARCDETVANMRKRNRKASDCTMKTAP